MKYNLLICDDNIYEIEIIYSYIEKIFSNHQIELEINKFIDVEQALEYAKSQQIDIALLDIDMGQGKSSGISLATNLLKKNPEIVNITNNIIYIERIGTRSRITTVKETFFIYETLKSLSSRLSTDFIQINQSTIVNINRINDYVKDQIIMCDKECFKVGRKYKKEADRFYTEHFF